MPAHALSAPKPRGRPPYPNRAVILPDSIKAEFGVETAHEMVARLNRAWAETGRPPLALGSYPTNQTNLRFVIRELRLLGAGS